MKQMKLLKLKILIGLEKQVFLKKIIILLLVLVLIPVIYASFLGEHKIGETVYFAAQFNNGSGTADAGANNVTYVIFNTSFDNKTPSNGIGMTAVSGYDGFYKGSYVIPSGADNGIWSIRINGSTTEGEKPAAVISFKVVSNITQDVYDDLSSGVSLTSETETQIDNIENNVTEIQGNQSNFVTATGVQTEADASTRYDTLVSMVNSLANVTLSDIWTYATRTLTSFTFSVNLTTKAVDDIDLRLNASHGEGNWSDISDATASNQESILTGIQNNRTAQDVNLSQIIANQSNIKLAVDASNIGIESNRSDLETKIFNGTLPDQVWDEKINATVHNITESAGERLYNLNISISQIPNSIWNESRTNYKTSGTFGNLMRKIKTALNIIE